MSYVFISYSKKNKDYAYKLADFLQENGFNIWIDRIGIEYGERWWDSIVVGIKQCGAFIVIMTPDARDSDWVDKEIHVALKFKIRIFPVLLEGENWELFYGDQVLAVQDELMPDNGFLDSIEKHVNRNRKQFDASESVYIPPDLSTILPPPFEWCEIPAGQFLYGDNKQTLELPTFYIAKYPITYAQFQVFLDAKDGFYDERWWEGLAADANHKKQPRNQLWKFTNHPRERASWYDAIAFCRWFSWLLTYPQHLINVIGRGDATVRFDMMNPSTWTVRLPTEQEWEKAARGTDGRIYPWGDKFDENKCNSGVSGINQTTPVRRYLNGASPYGVMDMSGNVREWCLTEYDSAKSDSLANDYPRVIRGGSWNDYIDDVRTNIRVGDHPNDRDSVIGFRIACSLPPLNRL